MIRVRGLSYAYGSHSALRDVDLDLRPGEHVAILGRNGSGKSTFLKCLAGLLHPTAGRIEIDGRPLTGPDPSIGLVFQNPDDQIVSPVVESEVAFGLENLGVPREEMVPRVEAALERFDLVRYRSADPHRLSGGERQRLALASIVALEPRFLLLDEPYATLDPAFRAEASAIVDRFTADDITPVVVLQDPDDAVEADRLLVFAEGRIVEDGQPRALLSRPECLTPSGLPPTTSGRLAAALGMPAPLPVRPVELLAAARTLSPPDVPEHLPARAPPDDTAVDIAGLRFTYDAGLPTARTALDGVNLTIRRGEAVALVGPSGSGKSTLVLHLNGLLVPQSGTVVVAGHDTADRKAHDALRRRVGLVFQSPESQLFAETVAEDVSFGPRNHGLDRIDQRVDDALLSVGLPPGDYRQRNPFTLSGGEKHRVALAGVLASSPDVLVLDEPAAGLDPSGADELDAILSELSAAGVTVLRVTHDLCRAAACCDRIVCLRGGRVAFDLPAAEALSGPDRFEALGTAEPPGLAIVRALRDRGWAIPPRILTSDVLAAALTAGNVRAP